MSISITSKHNTMRGMQGLLLFTMFFLLYTHPIHAQGLFGLPKVLIPQTTDVMAFNYGDLDADGDIDIILASYSVSKIAWCKNDGTGHFGSPINIPTEKKWISSIHIRDINGDGHMDFIATSQYSNEVFSMKNDGNGSFGEYAIIFKSSDGVAGTSPADIDGDGDIDVIWKGKKVDYIAWSKNNGEGKFGIRNIIAYLNENPSSMRVVDMNNDGRLDILAAFNQERKIVWYENKGNGFFGNIQVAGQNNQKIISDYAGYVNSVYAVDLDGDGDIDVLSASNNEDEIAWYENDGEENFSTAKKIANKTTRAHFISAADLDFDGDMDVLSASNDNYKLVWYENNGEENFGEENYITNKKSIHIFDFDNDEKLDILTKDGSDIVWYENLSNYQRINSFSFQDMNENGVYDTDEKPLSSQKILLEPWENSGYTNLDGDTYFFADLGDYQLKHEPQTLWELTTQPKTYNVTISENSELSTYYFGFKPTRILPRVEPYLNSSPTRCNRESTYWLHYTNTGTTIANGTVTLEPDELMDFISSNPEPNLIEGRKLTWNITDLHPSFENKIRLQFQMPDFNSMGEILEAQASIELFNDNQELVYSKSTEYDSEVLCSYDPNDKLTRSNLLGQSEFAYIEDTIYYTIRFQNTGNDVAFDIRVEDTLDKNWIGQLFIPSLQAMITEQS